MKKGIVIALAVAGGLVALGAGGFYYLSRPVDAIEFEDAVSPETRAQNTKLRTVLMFAGIETALVDMNAARTYVGYDAPTDEPMTADDWQRVVIGTAATAAPDAPSIKVRQFVDGVERTTWTVATAKVLAYQNGDIGVEELEAAITKTTP